MDAEGGMFIIGVLIGLIVTSVVTYSLSEADLKECAEQHNIFQCEWVAVPVETDQ